MTNDVFLNGVNIRDSDPRIIVTGVLNSVPKDNANVSYASYSHGGFLAKNLRQSLSSAITLYIKESDLAEREIVHQAIRKWGRYAGYLTTGVRENQRLYVEDMDVKTSGKRRNEVVTLTFTAYANPFWENAISSNAAIGTAALSGSSNLFAPGNADECKAEAEITAVGGTLNSLTLSVGDTSMTFESLGVAAESSIVISHSAKGLLTITKGSTSLMPNRTAASDDELLAIPGTNNAVSFTSDVTCTAKFSTRGRWL